MERLNADKKMRVSQDCLDDLTLLAENRESYNDTLRRILNKYKKITHKGEYNGRKQIHNSKT